MVAMAIGMASLSSRMRVHGFAGLGVPLLPLHRRATGGAIGGAIGRASSCSFGSPATVTMATSANSETAGATSQYVAADDSKGQWRPTVDDVVRISWGKPAKQKGTGSRGVPHRLNADERAAFDYAVAKGYLEVGGSGWRKQRRDAPLLNTYRSYCDARKQASVVIFKDSEGNDQIALDLSPLRRPADAAAIAADVFAAVAGVLGEWGGVPPTVEGLEIGVARGGGSGGGEGGEDEEVEGVAGDGGEGAPAASVAADVERLEAAVAAKSAEVRALKEEGGLGNKDAPVVEAVAELKALKSELEAANILKGGVGVGRELGAGGEAVMTEKETEEEDEEEDSVVDLASAEMWLTLPIYRLPVQTLIW